MFLDEIMPTLSKPESKLYKMQWDKDLFNSKSEKIIIDEQRPSFADGVLDVAEHFLGRINYDSSLDKAEMEAEAFSRIMAETLPFLWFESADEFHKNDIWKKTGSIWPRYLSTFDLGPRRLSDLEETSLTCMGQSMNLSSLVNNYISSGWRLYNAIVAGVVRVHGFMAKELKDGYVIVDPSLAKFPYTKFVMSKQDFVKSASPAVIVDLNQN